MWAIEPTNAMNAVARYASLIGLYVLLSLTPVGRREVRFVLWLVLVSGCIAGAYTVWLFHSGGTWNADVNAPRAVIMSNADTWVDPNDFAAGLLLPSAVALWTMVNSRLFLTRCVGAGSLLLLMLAVVATGSRGGVISQFALFAWFAIRSRHRFFIMGGLAVSVVAGLILNPSIITRFQTIAATDAAGRTDIWKIGAAFVPSHWLAGAGVGNFAQVLIMEHLNVFIRYKLSEWGRPAHNVYMQIMVELGVLGLTLFVTALILQFRSMRKVPRDHPDFELRIALEAAFVGLIVASAGLNTIDAKSYWLLLGLMSLVRTSALRYGGEE
jgi:O-antigen ligase